MLRTATTSSTTKPRAGCSTSPPSPWRTASSAVRARSAVAVTPGRCSSRITVAKDVSTRAITTQ
ncbi:MAG: hypothetical protein AVDCRST_MAG61-1319 [uncultured Friedmanniella sp.]|uniref:Uncharacterized protein n=1 Tax=uncultured Friedmanniella sp. TaxID=335381 RepID=A0A6J4KG02_9ACTN|nr:MAG: hypothetical protein AVDCRST_MAG61-1319 [uncultured Friedmanniella sp.]